MDVVHPRCCGIDVHKPNVCCCISIKDNSRIEKLKRRFDSTTGQLREMAAWLKEHNVTTVAMEATGVYWKPVWNLLETEFELLLVNPQHLKSIPGKKTDFKDGERIADLLQHGLLRGSFVPPQEIRELRDLTRMRASLAQERSSVINRIEKTLEDPNLKLGVVASDVVGASGRAMLNSIVKGETDPATLAQLAKGTLRNKIPQLKLALEARSPIITGSCCGNGWICWIFSTLRSLCWRNRSSTRAALLRRRSKPGCRSPDYGGSMPTAYWPRSDPI